MILKLRVLRSTQPRNRHVPRFKRLKRLGGLSILLALTACSTPNIAPTALAVEEMCEAWGQINKRKADQITAETATEIAENNLAREAFGCPYEPPPKRVAGR
jgi:hypothetical protein